MSNNTSPDVAEIVAKEIGTPPDPNRGWATRGIEYLCALLMLAMVVLLFTQVVGRYLLSDPPEWTEELARMVFVHVTFIAAALAVVRKAHLKIDSITASLPKRVQAAVNSIGIFAAIIFLAFVIYYSSTLLTKLAHQELSTVPISKAYMFASVPLGCALVLIYECGRLFKELRYLIRGDLAAQSARKGV